MALVKVKSDELLEKMEKFMKQYGEYKENEAQKKELHEKLWHEILKIMEHNPLYPEEQLEVLTDVYGEVVRCSSMAMCFDPEEFLRSQVARLNIKQEISIIFLSFLCLIQTSKTVLDIAYILF